VQHFNTIIIGASHNGLICAAYLARSDQRVLVLEAGDTVGGLAATRTFHPGYMLAVAHSVSQFPGKIARDLDLTAHGYQPGNAIATTGLSEVGEHVTIKGDKVLEVKEDDTAAYDIYRKMMLRYADVLKPFWLKTIPRIGNNSFKEIMTFAKMGLRLRLLGKEDMREFLRIISLAACDLLNEYFDSEILKAMLSWNGLIGSKMAPRSRIIGAGHNGLTNAANLAKAGLDVVVVEKNAYIGGAAVSRELHNGFTYSNCSYVCSMMRQAIHRDLNLMRSFEKDGPQGFRYVEALMKPSRQFISRMIRRLLNWTLAGWSTLKNRVSTVGVRSWLNAKMVQRIPCANWLLRATSQPRNPICIAASGVAGKSATLLPPCGRRWSRPISHLP
jgi:phytoene dehydrogenase-like protein